MNLCEISKIWKENEKDKIFFSNEKYRSRNDVLTFMGPPEGGEPVLVISVNQYNAVGSDSEMTGTPFVLPVSDFLRDDWKFLYEDDELSAVSRLEDDE